jgi:hypothetical protein
MIHTSLVPSPGKIKESVAISKSIYHSLPTPLEELKNSTTKSIENMRDSGRFLHFDFENLEGNLNITSPTEEIDEMEVTFQQSRAERQVFKQTSFKNFQADDEQIAKSRDFLSRTYATKETNNYQKDIEISPLYERQSSPTIPMNQGQSHPSSQTGLLSTPFGAGTLASNMFEGQYFHQPTNTIISSSSGYHTGGGLRNAFNSVESAGLSIAKETNLAKSA